MLSFQRMSFTLCLSPFYDHSPSQRSVCSLCVCRRRATLVSQSTPTTTSTTSLAFSSSEIFCLSTPTTKLLWSESSNSTNTRWALAHQNLQKKKERKKRKKDRNWKGKEDLGVCRCFSLTTLNESVLSPWFRRHVFFNGHRPGKRKKEKKQRKAKKNCWLFGQQ